MNGAHKINMWDIPCVHYFTYSNSWGPALDTSEVTDTQRAGTVVTVTESLK